MKPQSKFNQRKSILGKPLSNSGIRAKVGSDSQCNCNAIRRIHNSALGLERGCSGCDSKHGFGNKKITRGLAEMHIESGPREGTWRKNAKSSGTMNPLATRKSINKAKGFDTVAYKGETSSKKMNRVKCYKCRNRGHLAANCTSKSLQIFSFENKNPKDYLVKGTENGNWDKIWVVNPLFKKHMTGDKSMFKNLKKHFSLDTKIKGHRILYSHGIGEVEIPMNGKMKLVPSVKFAPALKKNVLSLSQLIDQGFEVALEYDKCCINGMFDTEMEPCDNEGGGNCIGNLENNYINNCYDTLDDQTILELEKGKLESEIEGWFDPMDNMIGDPNIDQEKAKQPNEDWVNFLDSLHIPNYVMLCKESLRKEFGKFVKLFYEEHFNQTDKEYPPKLLNGEEVDLFDLYLYVEEAGGNRKATKEGKWLDIASKLGLQQHYASNLMIIYSSYLDLMAWKYNTIKDEKQDASTSVENALMQEKQEGLNEADCEDAKKDDKDQDIFNG